MAMANVEEERVLEEQFQFHLNEQRESLSAVADALSTEPDNAELLSIHVELIQAIKDVEESLFHLKRARLLREADSAFQVSACCDDVKCKTLDSTDIVVEPPQVEQSYSIGSMCRFRYTDGRWYNGLIIGSEGSDTARISFLTPTSENMLMCKFFQQERCRFGSNCRLSHGITIPISSIKKYIPTIWEQSLVGSSIWALSDCKTGIWREAELESWDDKLKTGKIVFRDNGSSANVGTEGMALSEYANNVSSEEEIDTSSACSSDYESQGGLGFLSSTKLQRGVQSETAIFAKWENHTRGIASKMMANMGYKDGMGLGASGQGILDPISVRADKSLDHVVHSNEMTVRKRTRGGTRKCDKKLAAATKTAEEEEDSKDVFSLINTQLAVYGQRFNVVSKQENNGNVDANRRTMIAYEDEIKKFKVQIEKLEEMANRNRKEKAVYEAAMRKLNETRKALADTETAHASTSNAVHRKEKEKKWLKF